jgi:hypothetical protein
LAIKKRKSRAKKYVGAPLHQQKLNKYTTNSKTLQTFI